MNFRWEGEDISPEKDESISRSVRDRGEGTSTPKEGAQLKGMTNCLQHDYGRGKLRASIVSGRVIGYFDGRVILDKKFDHELGEGHDFGFPKGTRLSPRRRRHHPFTLRSTPPPPPSMSGMDEALRRFKRGERSVVTLKSKWAFGKEGSEPLKIPPYSPIQLDLTLRKFQQVLQ